MNKVIQGDCLEELKKLEENSIDSIVTDPPYELGFMGKSWDNTGIANNVELWKECLRVLKPGGYLLSFGGTRTYHRMASAIEDAGFEVRDMIEWVYGSGFPKSLNIGKAIDKLQGNKREVSGYEERFGREGRKANCGFKEEYVGASGTQDQSAMKPIMLPVSNEAKQWEGWGTALKPAHEPICMARKPLAEKTVAENVLKYGTGGINIDDSRVETSDKYSYPNGAGGNSFSVGEEPDGKRTEPVESNSLGRFPANLIHDNSEEVRECFPETKSGGGNKATKTAETFLGTGFGGTDNSIWECDSGNASRFFKSIIYQAKASKSGRGEDNNHPTVKPIALMEYLIKMVTPKGGTVLDPFAGSGTTLLAAKELGYEYIGIEKEKEYIDIINKRISGLSTV